MARDRTESGESEAGKASKAGRVRLDKWLWAARFFKTRAVAAEAIQGGRVHAGGARVKPSRIVALGDRLEITKGRTAWEVVVRELGERRRPAPEAQRMYEETEASRRRREQAAAEARARALPRTSGTGRPSKRDRRRMEQALRKSLR